MDTIIDLSRHFLWSVVGALYSNRALNDLGSCDSESSRSQCATWDQGLATHVHAVERGGHLAGLTGLERQGLGFGVPQL